MPVQMKLCQSKQADLLFSASLMTTKNLASYTKCGEWEEGGGRDYDEHFHDSNIMLSFVAFMIISNILYICIIYDMAQGCYKSEDDAFCGING